LKQSQLSPKFVEYIPEVLEDGVLYVAMEFQMVAHRCCCGCGSPVFLPLNPTQWRLTFDGEAIWMEPSIGSWSLPCRSHYWIRGNRVQWAGQWTPQQVEAVRRHDRQQREEHFSGESASAKSNVVPAVPVHQTRSRWARIKAFFRWG